MQHHGASQSPTEGGVLVQHRVAGFAESWVIVEGPVPEAAWHDRALELLKALLEHWSARTGRDAAVFRNLAVRVQRDRPSAGFDPDLIIVEPAPPSARDLSSLRLWETGHAVPAFVIEVVSPGHPYKDYAETPDKCAALGVGELVVFDPLLVGPKAFGGPHRIQVWRQTEMGTFSRVAAGEGSVHSAFLGAHLVPTDEGRCLRIAGEEDGSDLWPTPEEAERTLRESERAAKERALAAKERALAAKERALAAQEDERAQKEKALARVAELERELVERAKR
jgi:Uma2 family endonuclease